MPKLSSQFPLHGIGTAQIKMLKSLLVDQFIIHTIDEHDNSTDIVMQDADGNIFYDVSKTALDGLISRKVLNWKESRPAIHIYRIRFDLKPELKDTVFEHLKSRNLL